MYIEIVTLFVISLAPIVILLWYFDHLDKTNPESRRFLWSIFMWGVMVTFVAGGLEYLLDTYLTGLFYVPLVQLFITAFVFTAVTEEGLKYWVIKNKAWPHPAFNEHFDGIIYSVVASLGFAALENVFYVFENGIFIGVIRALMAVPAHALFGCMMGYYIGLAKFEKNNEKRNKLLRKGLLLAIFFHGLYDFLLLAHPLLALVAIPLLMAMAINVRHKIAHLHLLDKIKGTIEPPKWKIADYIKTFFGMIFFTIGVLAIFIIALYYSGDPIGMEFFSDVEFFPTETFIFLIINWGIAYLFLRKKNKLKSQL